MYILQLQHLILLRKILSERIMCLSLGLSSPPYRLAPKLYYRDTLCTTCRTTTSRDIHQGKRYIESYRLHQFRKPKMTSALRTSTFQILSSHTRDKSESFESARETMCPGPPKLHHLLLRPYIIKHVQMVLGAPMVRRQT